jgi:hypothetical protein
VDTLRVDVSDRAPLNVGTKQINLWQRNMIALRCECEIGFAIRDDARFVKLVTSSEVPGMAAATTKTTAAKKTTSYPAPRFPVHSGLWVAAQPGRERGPAGRCRRRLTLPLAPHRPHGACHGAGGFELRHDGVPAA